MQQQTIRRLILAGACTAAGIGGAVAFDQAAAHAADKPPAVEQPGGLLDQLPAQAADRAKQVVDQVVPDKPEPPKAKPPKAEPEPVEEPAPPKAEPPAKPAPKPTETPAPPANEPDPADEPEPRTTEPDPIIVELPTDPIVDMPPVEVPPIVIEVPPVVVIPPVVVETPPVVIEPAPTSGPIDVILPAIDPAPLPLPQLPVVPPGGLPVLIGPVPAVQPAPAAEPGQMEPAAAVAALKVPDCADRPDDAVNVNRDAIRQLITSLTEPAATPRAKPAHGCPGAPGSPDQRADCASTGPTSSTQTGNGHIHADLAGSLTAPALTRLTHARPRGSIPAGRHTAIEPGPA